MVRHCFLFSHDFLLSTQAHQPSPDQLLSTPDIYFSFQYQCHCPCHFPYHYHYIIIIIIIINITTVIIVLIMNTYYH